MFGFLGTSAHRQDTHPPEDASGLSELVVKDLDGQEIRLGSLWAERPVVLVWLRHYG